MIYRVIEYTIRILEQPRISTSYINPCIGVPSSRICLKQIGIKVQICGKAYHGVRGSEAYSGRGFYNWNFG